MSRFGRNILSLLFLLILALPLYLSRQESTSATLFSWLPGQRESIKIPRPSVGRMPADYLERIQICPLTLEDGTRRIVWHNTHLFAAGAQNFFILDPAGAQEDGVQAPTILGSCLAPALCLAMHGQYAYLGSVDGKLRRVDISNPGAPVLLDLPLKGGPWGEGETEEKNCCPLSSIQGIALLEPDLLIVSEKLKGISLLDISDSKSPRIVGQWREKGNSTIHYGDLALVENKGTALAAVLWESADPSGSEAGFWLVDISLAHNPEELAKVMTDRGPLGIAASGSHLFLANSHEQSLEIYDLTSPLRISRIDSYPVGKVTRMLAAEDILYLAQGEQGVQCLDISCPDRPALIGHTESGGDCIDLAAGEGKLYLLNRQGDGSQEQGLRVIGIAAGAEEAALFPDMRLRQSWMSVAAADSAAAGSGDADNDTAGFFGWLSLFSGGRIRVPVFPRRPSQQNGTMPVISSITPRNVQAESLTGTVMTLTGSRLSAQSCGNWIHFSESQGSFEDTTGWKKEANCWVRDNWECWAPTAARRDEDVIFDSRMAILGNQSYCNNIHYTATDWKYARECPGKGEFYNLTWWEARDADQYYYRYYVRYSGPAFQWTDNSWKQLYVHNLFNLNPCMWDHPSVTQGPARYDIQGETRIFAHLPGPIALERWYCIEIWAKKNGAGLNLKFWLDGEECEIYDEYDKAPQQFPWSKCYHEKARKLVFGPLELGTTNCQNWRSEQLPVKQCIWFDGFAMSSTRIYPASLVEIGNLSDYARATRVKQEILHISDTQIRFRANTQGLGRGPYYLWVTNNRQERSRAYLLRVKN
ncbi:MAG: hypothetical protein AB1611_09175 [bacterium]